MVLPLAEREPFQGEPAMTRTAAFAIAALVGLVAAPLVVHATGRSSQEPTKVASVETTGSTMATAEKSPAAGPETCARRVKVVYPAYGVPAGGMVCAAPRAAQR
jgi:hypothetical protein